MASLGVGSSLALVTALVVILQASEPVSGKCTGKWAIHSCAGGNGKRSDDNSLGPPPEELQEAPPGERLTNLLQQYIKDAIYRQLESEETGDSLQEGDSLLSQPLDRGNKRSDYDFDKLKYIWRRSMLAKRAAPSK